MMNKIYMNTTNHHSTKMTPTQASKKENEDDCVILIATGWKEKKEKT